MANFQYYFSKCELIYWDISLHSDQEHSQNRVSTIEHRKNGSLVANTVFSRLIMIGKTSSVNFSNRPQISEIDLQLDFQGDIRKGESKKILLKCTDQPLFMHKLIFVLIGCQGSVFKMLNKLHD